MLVLPLLRIRAEYSAALTCMSRPVQIVRKVYHREASNLVVHSQQPIFANRKNFTGKGKFLVAINNFRRQFRNLNTFKRKAPVKRNGAFVIREDPQPHV